MAGRGFWPGLCTTLKHPCRFASFTLLVKGDYPAELDVPLPFSLLSDDRANDRLLVIPAYWWRYNMYALARNTWKFTSRDTRKTKTQHIEFDCLAPDTVEEIFVALRLLELWAGKARLRAEGKAGDCPNFAPAKMGLSPLTPPLAKRSWPPSAGRRSRVPRAARPNWKSSARTWRRRTGPVVILKARQAYAAYQQMLHYYAVKNLLAYMEAASQGDARDNVSGFGGPRERNWVNLGGQLVPEPEVQRLLEDIKAGRLQSLEGDSRSLR